MQPQKERDRETDFLLKSAITRLLGLKLIAGSTVEETKIFLEECITEAALLEKQHSSRSPFDIHSIGSVLRSWHTKAEYLRADGTPRPLGVKNKLELPKLISLHFPSRSFDAAFATLKKSKLIKRSRGRKWIPSERHARVPQATAEVFRHLAEGVARLAETVMKNTQSEKKEDLLFERACKVFHLPVSEAQAFRHYMQKQGVAFLEAIDDWLETRSSRSAGTRKKTCSAGAFAFAFIDDKQPSATKLRRARARRPN
jgi:hypothetical protein